MVMIMGVTLYFICFYIYIYIYIYMYTYIRAWGRVIANGSSQPRS